MKLTLRRAKLLVAALAIPMLIAPLGCDTSSSPAERGQYPSGDFQTGDDGDPNWAPTLSEQDEARLEEGEAEYYKHLEQESNQWYRNEFRRITEPNGYGY